ncbi:MAG: hypothetical protein AAGA03_18065, partial [Planctomycetota bacterium]
RQPGPFRIVRSMRSSETDVTSLRIADVPASESLLRDAQAEKLQTLADRLGADVYQAIGEVIGDNQLSRFGREIWRPILALLLVVVVMEILVQQRLMPRQRRSGDDQPSVSPNPTAVTT